MSIPPSSFYELANRPDIQSDDVVSVKEDGNLETKTKTKAEAETEKAKFSRRVTLVDVKKNNSRSVEAFISSLERTHGRDSEFMKRLDVMALRNLKESGEPLRARHIRAIHNDNPTPTTRSRLISIGGGPRGISQASEEIKFLKLLKPDFIALKKLGGKPFMTTTVIDRGKFEAFGLGAAWTEQNRLGTANTGAELGYENRLLAYYRAHKKEILTDLKRNL